ncbi:MAG: hypothetical protein IPJ82_16195 [Lewinellaceae bacterium]|nr:hypothetical protein [Lewinellaceae bacterium]
MTADKDDPRFDRFYLAGNEIRYFIALFLTDMPSYMGLGFECRDPHPQPAPNEFYTKLYVFQMPDGEKGTRGVYQWGKNEQLYGKLVRQKILAQEIFPAICEAGIDWVLAPDPEGVKKLIAWTQSDRPQYLFVANLDTSHSHQTSLVLPGQNINWEICFSTETEQTDPVSLSAGATLRQKLLPGEGLVYRASE